MPRTRRKFLIMLMLGIFVLSGCSLLAKFKNNDAAPGNGHSADQLAASSSPQDLKDKSGQNKVKKFADFNELRRFLEDNPPAGNNGYAMSEMARNGMVMEKTLAAPQAAADSSSSFSASQPAGNSDYSRTNNQIEGVDEADIIKTDGQYIYVLSKKSLHIIEARPADKANIISTIEFDSQPQDIFVNQDRLVVFGNDDAVYNQEIYKTFRRQSSFTFLKVFDIGDRKNPRQLRDLDFEGAYNDSRLIGDHLYFVTSNYNFYYIDDLPIARVLDGGKELPTDRSAPLCNCPELFYFDLPYNSYNFTNIYALNIKDNSQAFSSQTYMMPGNQNIFVSEKNLYLTYAKHISPYQIQMEVMKDVMLPQMPAKYQDRIAKITQADNFILTPEEKLNKINTLIQSHIAGLGKDEQEKISQILEGKYQEKFEAAAKELEKTVIHKIAIDKEKLAYVGYGEVSGTVLNQFSMDEDQGNFRIATTRSQQWMRDNSAQESYNNLFILDPDMKVIGALEGLAPGERIYSARFMGNRAFMVTFRQTDPLFVIDLKDPRAPRVLGQLKVPGFSSYLHPYDENTLIGLGKDTEEQTAPSMDPGLGAEPVSARMIAPVPTVPRVVTKGIKLSLFDISDLAKPREISHYEMGGAGSDSIALYDHHAFLFDKERKLLALPVSLTTRGSNNSWSKLEFSGLAVFNIDQTKIELKGKIDHSDNGTPGSREDWLGYNYYDNTVTRSIYIGNELYSFSSNYMKVNQISDLKMINSLQLKKKEQKDYKVIN